MSLFPVLLSCIWKVVDGVGASSTSLANVWEPQQLCKDSQNKVKEEQKLDHFWKSSSTLYAQNQTQKIKDFSS